MLDRIWGHESAKDGGSPRQRPWLFKMLEQQRYNRDGMPRSLALLTVHDRI